jgi:hypothetical protein
LVGLGVVYLISYLGGAFMMVLMTCCARNAVPRPWTVGVAEWSWAVAKVLWIGIPTHLLWGGLGVACVFAGVAVRDRRNARMVDGEAALRKRSLSGEER